MSKNRFSKTVLLLGALVLTAGAAVAAARTGGTPTGEPTIPGVSYATGAGAPYLSTKGSPRKLSGFGIGPLTGPLQKKAVVAGTAAGKAAGTGAKLPKLTVGYLDIIGGIESADRVDNSLRTAFQHLGAKWIYCDGQGSPQKWATCGNSLIAQHVNLIALTGIDPSTIPSVLSAAKAKNIPIVDFGGAVGPGYATAFAPNEPKAGAVLAAYLKAKLASQTGTSDILTLNYPASWAQQRTAQLEKVVAGDPNLKIAAKATTDPTNLIAGTQKTVTDELTADPNLKAIWADFDTAGQAAGQTLASQYPGKSFPDRPLLVTFHADPSTQTLMHSGAIDAVVDVNYDATAWELADAVAEHYAHNKPWPKYSVGKAYPGIGDPVAYQIVTPKNLPPTGTYVAPNADVDTYFITKWKTEGFGK
jgi:ABC-type sugar transport system substrate-binding protein